jgi:hypothetical protein
VSSQVHWSSSVDGSIGEGVGLLISLSDGHHEITATLRDSSGNTTSDRMQIQMGEPSQSSSTEVISVQD